MKSIIVCMLIMFIVSPLFASDIEDTIDALMFAECQLGAVTTEMYMALRWCPEDKELIQGMSESCIDDLRELEIFIQKECPAAELTEVKSFFFALIEKLTTVYDGIEEKKIENVKTSFDEFHTMHDELRKKFGEMIKKYKEESNVPADFDYVDTLSWQDDDKTVYRDAITLLDEKQGVKAYEMLKELRQKYEDTLIEDCIIMRMTYFILTVDTDFEEVEKTREEALGLLAGILDGGKYSPVFSDVFYRWRTTTQSFHHGMSNMSNIPNKEYNAVRWRLINIIKQHLEKNPDDLRAKGQIDMLLLLPNILRGGAYGNLNILHFGVLYTDTYKDKAA